MISQSSRPILWNKYLPTLFCLQRIYGRSLSAHFPHVFNLITFCKCWLLLLTVVGLEREFAVGFHVRKYHIKAIAWKFNLHYVTKCSIWNDIHKNVLWSKTFNFPTLWACCLLAVKHHFEYVQYTGAFHNPNSFYRIL